MAATESEGSYGAILSSFTASVKADLDSPITSNFGNRIVEYRNEAQRIVDEIDGYAADFERLRKCAREVEDTLSNLTKQLMSFGQMAKEIATKWTSKTESQNESDAAIILLKMECYIKDEADLMNLQMRNWQNNIVTPFLSVVDSGREIRNRGVERSCRDYENKYVKAEADAKKHAKHVGYTRSQVGHGELAEQLTRERFMVQHELCKFLMSVDTIEDLRGPQLLRHFMELVRNQNLYYMNRMRANEDFRQDMLKLEERMMARNANRCAQRNTLWDLRSQLEANEQFKRFASGRRSSGRESSRGVRLSGVNLSNASIALSLENDSLNELFTNTSFFPDLDFIESGYLYKKSNKKLHKQWQKRRCRIEDGHFWLSHSDESVPPTKISLLISDCKLSASDPKSFDLYCRERTYHLQADSETDAKRWIIALKREITRVKRKILSGETAQSSGGCRVGGFDVGGSTGDSVSELIERKLCINKVRQLPGNYMCADCSSKEDVQWLSNMGALVCIACSGIHRELGVHVSRIQSLNLDVILPLELLVPLSSGNAMINRIFEYDVAKCTTWKPVSGCTGFDRQRFIQMKYRDRAFVQNLEDPDACLTEAFDERDFEGAYRALVSQNLTRKPFLRNGPFHQMVLRGASLSLPLADLVMQLRIEIPDMETIMMDCIRCGNADMLTVLLRYRSLSPYARGIHLQSLIACAENAEQKKIAEMLKSMQSGNSSQMQNVTVPSALFISTSDSASLSRSSSSVSPCPRLPQDMPSSQCAVSTGVNVLMRNGTTVSFQSSSGRNVENTVNENSSRSNVELSQFSVGMGLVSRLDSDYTSAELNCTHGGRRLNISSESDGEKGLLASEVPLRTSTPTSSSPSHIAAVPNHYSRAPGDFKVISELSISLDSASALQTFPPTPPILTIPAKRQQKVSSSEFVHYPENVKDVSGSTIPAVNRLALQPNCLRGDSGLLETTFPITASVSLDPLSLHSETSKMDKCLNSPGPEAMLGKEKHVATARFEKKSKAISNHEVDEHEYGSKCENAIASPTSDLQSGVFRRVPRPAPPPPAQIGVRLKPPIPAPRRIPSITRSDKQRDSKRRCRALYDCNADNPDELSFRQGDIIVITKERIAGENDTWMDGYLENNPLCKGVFPTTFVTFLS